MRRFILAFALAHAASAQVHVDGSAPMGGDGASWASAFQSLDDALAVAGPGDQVWVAEGIYRPTVEGEPGQPRTAAFAPGTGVRLIGGFRGTETDLTQRGNRVRQTILDGDIGIPGDPSDNAFNVVRLEGNGAAHWVDGFTIRGGNADGSGLAGGGGAIGMQAGTKFIRNCFLVGNRGRSGGAILSRVSILSIERCTFQQNEAIIQGGALFAAGTCGVTDSLFRQNRAAQRGGAVLATQGLIEDDGIPQTRFQNCEFWGNIAARGGAAFVRGQSQALAAGKAIWSGCTFAANGAFLDGGAVASPATFGSNVDVMIVNSTIWGNRSTDGTTLSGNSLHYRQVASCIIQGGFPGTNVMDVNPRFVNLGTGDLRLQPSSPGIDAGDPKLILRDFNDLDRDGDYIEPTPTDRHGAPRRRDDPVAPNTGPSPAPHPDLSPYEH